MTIELSFEEPIYFTTEGTQFLVNVTKKGTGSCEARVSTTGSTLKSTTRYPVRAIKAKLSGDFYAKNQTLVWEEGDESNRTILYNIAKDNIDESPEIFYSTITTKTPNVVIDTNRTHIFILDNPNKFFSRFVEGNVKNILGDNKQQLISPEVQQTTLDIRFVDPMGYLFPTNYASINYQKSQLNYTRQANIAMFSGNIRADISTPEERAVDSEGNQLDSYLMLTLELPFKNVMDYPIPVTMSSSRVFGFYRMRESTNGMFTSSLRAYIAPNSNLVFFEFISSEESNYTSNLVLLRNRTASLWISIQGTAFVEDSQTTSEPWKGYQGHYWT